MQIGLCFHILPVPHTDLAWTHKESFQPQKTVYLNYTVLHYWIKYNKIYLKLKLI